MTMNKWRKIDIHDPVVGYMRFIVEYLKRVSFVETYALQDRLEKVELLDEFTIASNLRMPISEVKKYLVSLVPWKRECIQFIMSIDVKLMKAQRKVLVDILNAQKVDTLDDYQELEMIRVHFSENRQPEPIFRFTKKQQEDPRIAPTKEQLQIVSKIAIQKGKVIPPKVRVHADRLLRWGTRTILLDDME